MAQFKEGQEVEVLMPLPETDITKPCYEWRRAEIVIEPRYPETKEFYKVRFSSDGSYRFIEADTIRPIQP